MLRSTYVFVVGVERNPASSVGVAQAALFFVSQLLNRLKSEIADTNPHTGCDGNDVN